MGEDARIDSRQTVGSAGELAVRERIEAAGWTVVDYNVRWREGELDVIALDGGDLVFAEVKTLVARGGSATTAFSPFESIGPRKQLQVRRLARRWVADHLAGRRRLAGRHVRGMRFDAFAVTLAPDLEVLAIEHIEDAF
jgi:putative endonuclease